MIHSGRTGRGARATAAVGLTVALAAVLAAMAMAAAVQGNTTPSNTSPPTISGTPSTGSSLTASPGSWSGTPTPTFAYQWERCDSNGGNCADIVGATGQSYTLTSADSGNSLRVRVTATNSAGSRGSTTVPTAVVAAPSQPAPTGCPQLAQGGASVAVSGVNAPARLQIDGFQPSPGVIPGSMTSFSLRVHISDTCGQAVSGANVYATAVPYNQVTIPPQAATGNDGWVTLQFTRRVGFPASRKQRLMVMFIRASEPGQNPLTGISTERLVSLPLNLGT